MHGRSFSPLIEAFLILEQPRTRLGHWTHALTPLDDGRAPPLATVTAFYDPSTDQALLALRYDELALGPERLSFVIEVALLAEIGMIQPAELSEGDRRRFLGERLARCSMHVADQRTVVGALTELVRRVREHKLGPKTTIDNIQAIRPPAEVRRTPAARSTTAPRSVTEEPILRVTPKSTRDDVSPEYDTDRTGALGSDPQLPTVNAPSPPGIIHARYLRSGRWVPIRIGALSLRGAALMSGALPRLDDRVDIALSFGDHRAVVRGPVKKVSSREEAAMSGTATFSMAFDLDDTARRQLTTLLTAARAAHVTIKPPPPRTTRRYPVEWPVCLGTIRGAVRGEALDVSREGMFVRPVHALTLDSLLNFSVVLDDGNAPISGRAKVIRQIHEAEARTCGLAAGYGLQITDMGPSDRERWIQFLDRIERRAEKRVLIGASADRLAELQAALASVGYAVSCGSDPGALVQLAGVERPADAVLLDGGWLGASESWVEELFSSRKVPCVTMHGDARRGRVAIDKLLSVV